MPETAFVFNKALSHKCGREIKPCGLQFKVGSSALRRCCVQRSWPAMLFRKKVAVRVEVVAAVAEAAASEAGAEVEVAE